jgi:hypothetical protein
MLPLASLARAAAGPAAISELSEEDQAKVRNGLQVVITHPGAGSVWPEIRVYQPVDALPEDAAAVFADFARRREYLPDVTQSRVLRRPDRATADVAYTWLTHFVLHPRENLVLREHLSTYDPGTGAGYRCEWMLVSADDLRGDAGSARFEPLGSGALLAYTSFITPPVIAGGESAHEIARIQATATAIAERARRVRLGYPRQLAQELAALRGALGQ